MQVFVLSFDELPLHFLSCYGNLWVETPTWNHLAVEGACFDQHFSEDLHSAGFAQSWLTGCYHFPRKETSFTFPNPGLLLQQRQIRTTFVGDVRHPEDSWFETRIPVGKSSRHSALTRLSEVSRKQIRELGKEPTRSSLLWLHAPLLELDELPEEYRQRYAEDFHRNEDGTPHRQALLGGLAAWIDQFLKELLETLNEFGEADQRVLIITAGSGMNFVDRTALQLDSGTPAPALTEEQTHVPLLICHPDFRGERVSQLTHAPDLLPTILGFFGIESKEFPCEGQDLVSLLKGETLETRNAIYWGNGESTGIRTSEFHYLKHHSLPEDSRLLMPPEFLFRKPEDRWDLTNQSSLTPMLIEECEDQVNDFLRKARTQCPLPPPELVPDKLLTEEAP